MPSVSPIIRLSLLGAVAMVAGIVVMKVGVIVGLVVGLVAGLVIGLVVGLLVGVVVVGVVVVGVVVVVVGIGVTCWIPVTPWALTAEIICLGLLLIIVKRTLPGRIVADARRLVADSVT